MAIEARPINGSVIAFKTTAPTSVVTLLALDLASGEVLSDYFTADQLLHLSENAKAVLSVIDYEDRAVASQGIVSRLLPISPLDAGIASLTVNADGGLALAQVAVAGTRYFAVQFPHSIMGGVNIGVNGESGGPEPVVSADNSFTATSPEELSIGMLAARNRAGVGIIRADPNDVQRMPALGIVVKIADGVYTVQTSGPVINIFTATGDMTMFVGADGYPTGNIGPVTYVQALGSWISSSTLSLSISSQLTMKSPT